MAKQMTVVRKSDNILAVRRPDLLEVWDWEKNEKLGLDPYGLACGSNKVAWWKCDNHPDGYDIPIGKKVAGRGCPYCSGRRITKGVNDMASLFPDIAAEWDHEKNGSLTPDAVLPNSTKNVWWVCPTHGSYQMPVVRRSSQGSGCRECGRERVRLARIRPKPGESLADLYPELSREWHPTKNGSITPSDVRAGSNKKVYWLGKCDHEWDAVIDSRARGGRGCPYCAGKKVLAGFNDLATVAPDVASEWHPTKNGDLTPSDVLAGSHDVYWWHGECGHDWSASCHNRVAAHTGCPECRRGRRVSFSEKAVYYYVSDIYSDAEQNAHVDIAGFGKMELDIWIPSISTAIEFDGYYWHNKSPERDARKDALCDESGIRLIRVREKLCNDYADCKAEIVKLDEEYGSKTLDRAIETVVRLIAGDGGAEVDVDTDRDNGEIMSLVKTDATKKSLSETFPEIAMQWHPELNGGLTANMFSYGSKFKAWWVCPNGHEPYRTTINSRTSGCGCPACGAESRRVTKRKPRPGRSLSERFPEIAREWHPTKNGDLTPADVSYGSRSYMVWWLCPNGHSYQMIPNGRTSGRGCPTCAHEAASERMREKWASMVPVGGQLRLDIAV